MASAIKFTFNKKNSKSECPVIHKFKYFKNFNNNKIKLDLFCKKNKSNVAKSNVIEKEEEGGGMQNSSLFILNL